ncbi:hypothetical protein H4R19_002110 [Coemansia spiralis]|nr:hypothetical protein H4R19_002110 [Coemansia spiralis]
MSTMPGLISGRPMHHQYHGPGPEPISMPPPLSPASAERAVYPDPRAIAAIPLEGLPYMVPGTVMYVPVLAMPPPNHQSAHPSHTMPLAQPILLPQSHILSPGSPPQPLVAIYPHMGSALHSLAGPYPGPAAPTRESTVSLPDPPKNTPAYPAAPQPHGPHPPIWPEPHESRRQAAHDRQPELAAAAGYYTSSAPPGIEKRAGIGSLDAMPPVRIEPLPSTGDADCTDGTSAAERTGSGKSE